MIDPPILLNSALKAKIFRKSAFCLWAKRVDESDEIDKKAREEAEDWLKEQKEQEKKKERDASLDPTDSAVEELKKMGFDENSSRVALRKAYNNVTRATGILVDKSSKSADSGEHSRAAAAVVVGGATKRSEEGDAVAHVPE